MRSKHPAASKAVTAAFGLALAVAPPVGAAVSSTWLSGAAGGDFRAIVDGRRYATVGGCSGLASGVAHRPGDTRSPHTPLAARARPTAALASGPTEGTSPEACATPGRETSKRVARGTPAERCPTRGSPARVRSRA